MYDLPCDLVVLMLNLLERAYLRLPLELSWSSKCNRLFPYFIARALSYVLQLVFPFPFNRLTICSYIRSIATMSTTDLTDQTQPASGTGQPEDDKRVLIHYIITMGHEEMNRCDMFDKATERALTGSRHSAHEAQAFVNFIIGEHRAELLGLRDIDGKAFYKDSRTTCANYCGEDADDLVRTIFPRESISAVDPQNLSKWPIWIICAPVCSRDNDCYEPVRKKLDLHVDLLKLVTERYKTCGRCRRDLVPAVYLCPECRQSG